MDDAIQERHAKQSARVLKLVVLAFILFNLLLLARVLLTSRSTEGRQPHLEHQKTVPAEEGTNQGAATSP